MLLIVPAIVIDLVRHRIGAWNRWAQSAASGAAFLVSFAAVQWPFANFLMSPASRNSIFATNSFRTSFLPGLRGSAIFFPDGCQRHRVLVHMAVAVLVAIVMTELGTRWGD